MKIKSFSATSDWFFVRHDGGEPYRLAGFAVIDGGDDDRDVVIGMVSIPDGSTDDVSPDIKHFCRLATVPRQRGSYKHISELKEIDV